MLPAQSPAQPLTQPSQRSQERALRSSVLQGFVGLTLLAFLIALPPAFALTLTPEVLATGLEEPVAVAQAGDERWFIVNKRGLISIWADGELLTRPFLDLTSRVLYTGEPQSEQGLLALAFHPDYAENGYFFVSFTAEEGDAVIARYQVSANNPDLALRSTERVLLTIPQPGPSHNINHLAFGPDGYLYVAVGDGGYQREPRCAGQETDHLRGKILRLDVDLNLDTAPYYGIPADNPFVGPDLPLDEIWALGLRNPWRLSFDQQTGDLYVADVGQDLREEVNRQPAGSPGGHNYGFKMMEGTSCRGSSANCPAPLPPCGDAGYTTPIFDYGHDSEHCAVIGGHIYRGSAVPALVGQYVFGDFCGSLMTAAASGNRWTVSPLSPSLPELVSFAEGPDGELYALAGTTFYRLTPLAPGGTLAFADAQLTVDEDAGQAVITVLRQGGTAGAISAEVVAVGETAIPGLDFTAVTTPLSFRDGDDGPQTVTIPILEDRELEGNEHFRLEFRNLRGAALGSPATADLTIADNELTPGPCVPGPTSLCLHNGRFRVEARWQTPDGRRGLGQAQALTRETGYFWFFNADNVEVTIKVLAGCFDPFNHYWVFAAGMTNVQVSLTVADTTSRQLKRYESPLGQPFAPIQDTRAFATCP